MKWSRFAESLDAALRLENSKKIWLRPAAMARAAKRMNSAGSQDRAPVGNTRSSPESKREAWRHVGGIERGGARSQPSSCCPARPAKSWSPGPSTTSALFSSHDYAFWILRISINLMRQPPRPILANGRRLKIIPGQDGGMGRRLGLRNRSTASGSNLHQLQDRATPCIVNGLQRTHSSTGLHEKAPKSKTN
jgi:hypothetical protein